MDALNSTTSRAATPSENMRALEKAVNVADQRIRMRRLSNTKAQLYLGIGFGFPFCCYMVYNFFAADGVMQNYKASSGAYMHFAQNWLAKPRSQMSIYRPEIEMSHQGAALYIYTKIIGMWPLYKMDI